MSNTVEQFKNQLAQLSVAVLDSATVLFEDYRTAPKWPGVYVIQDTVTDSVIYVGQGSGPTGMRDRFRHHRNKALGEFVSATGKSNGTKDVAAWRAARTTHQWKTKDWKIHVFHIHGAVDRTLAEGLAMKLFDPLCNDENYLDRLS